MEEESSSSESPSNRPIPFEVETTALIVDLVPLETFLSV